MKKPRTIMELINLSTEYLQQQGCDNARLDAEVLMGHVLAMDRLQLYIEFDRPLSSEEVDAYRQSIGLRGKRVPVSYITNKKEFLSHSFKVTKDVLIPRPETELLVEKVIALAQYFNGPKILDIGTGSGVIPICVANKLPCATLTAIDISDKALIIAKENASLENVNNISFVKSDLFANLSGSQKFDLICSNPPYIPTSQLQNVQYEVKQEPTVALDGGTDGLAFYRRIFQESKDFLNKPGYMVLEIGWDQKEAVNKIAAEKGFNLLETSKDYAGNDRVVVVKW